MLNQVKLKTENTLKKEDIIKSFYSFEEKSELKIGMELERLPIDKNFQAVRYFGDKGIKTALEKIAQKNDWQKILDDGILIGLKKNNSTITLEPGCQFEISTQPQKTVCELKNQIENIDKEIKPILNELRINLLEYGISPKTKVSEIEIYPKKRYQYMAKYLPGFLASSMMRETAGIQVTIDFQNEQDAIKKLHIFTKISPVMTAMFANSPIKQGKLTGYKSTRALAWLNTDKTRCGLISKKLFDKNYNFTFSDYVETVLNVPMLYFSRTSMKNNVTMPMRNDVLVNGKINFQEFMNFGFGDYHAKLNDYEIHQSLYFPEVRLKNYLEIRNHDCQKGDLKYSIPAIYKGLAYDEFVLDSLIDLFYEFEYEDVEQARFDVPKMAIEAKFGNKKIVDLAKEIIKLAKIGLKNDEDKQFVEPIEELLKDNLCPADLIIKNLY